MSQIDIEQLRMSYIDESLEGLSTTESLLSTISPSHFSSSDINEIFRAIHTIKGGSATFGFGYITEWTHTTESFLDALRSGKQALTQQLISELLGVVDALTEIFITEKNGQNGDSTALEKAAARLPVEQDESPDTNTEERTDFAYIRFKPAADIFETGNDPYRVIRELSQLGRVNSKLLADSIPTIHDDLTLMHLAWDITIEGNGILKQDIYEVFEWIQEDCEELRFEFTTMSPSAEHGKNTKARFFRQSHSMRVDIEKIDSLINLVGELVITQSMLTQGAKESSAKSSKTEDALKLLNRQLRSLQSEVIGVKMVPIGLSLNRIPRLIRDISDELGKEVTLNIQGESTEVDKTVSELITDPLTHIIRNAIDHGIEPPAERVKNGKPRQGTINVKAYQQGGSIFIEVSDDGNGIDPQRIVARAMDKGLINPAEELSESEIFDLIFMPGFSTADIVTNVSGRGVGMDVVRSNIEELNGTIQIQSTPGKGTRMKIKLPMTLAILDGQLVQVGEQTFIIPLMNIIESLRVNPAELRYVAGKKRLYHLRGEYLPIVDLFDMFSIENIEHAEEDALVVVEYDNTRAAILTTDLIRQQQIVVKNIETNYVKVDDFSGVTILGDGTVSFILDVPSLISHTEELSNLLNERESDETHS